MSNEKERQEGLRPCPFCGTAPKVRRYHVGMNSERTMMQIACGVCRYQHPWSTPTTARRTWNRQAETTPVRRIRGEGYTRGNADDPVGALKALDDFTHRWCMDVAATEAIGEPCFRCEGCPFCEQDDGQGTCAVKAWAAKNGGDAYSPGSFGCMSR